jgi:hypothetical protein
MKRAFLFAPLVAFLCSGYAIVSVDDDPFQPLVVFRSQTIDITPELGFTSLSYSLVGSAVRQTKQTSSIAVIVIASYRGGWRSYEYATVLGGARIVGSKPIDEFAVRCVNSQVEDCNLTEAVRVPLPVNAVPSTDLTFQVNGRFPFRVTVPAEDIQAMHARIKAWRMERKAPPG